jgi:hypothetical protein
VHIGQERLALGLRHRSLSHGSPLVVAGAAPCGRRGRSTATVASDSRPPGDTSTLLKLLVEEDGSDRAALVWDRRRPEFGAW